MAAPRVPSPFSPHLRLVESGEDGGPLLPDQAILRAFYAGEKGVGQSLYDYLFPVVDRTLYRILGCREADHADLVQATFEQIVRTLAKRKFAGNCPLHGWASAIACHVGLTALRSRRRERRVIDRTRDAAAETERPTIGADPERVASVRRDVAAVRRHLAAMDTGRATALLLHVMGHSLNEIAELTGVSVAAAQSRLSRGRRELEERFSAEQPASADPTRHHQPPEKAP